MDFGFGVVYPMYAIKYDPIKKWIPVFMGMTWMKNGFPFSRE